MKTFNFFRFTGSVMYQQNKINVENNRKQYVYYKQYADSDLSVTTG